MKVARVKVSAGRPDEFNADGNGYAPSGEGQFSRIAAHGRVTPEMLHATPARIGKGSKLPLQDLIREYEGRVRWFEAQLRIADGPARKAKLRKNLEIKSRRLTELRRELNLGGWS
jgi:hypothetical protein